MVAPALERLIEDLGHDFRRLTATRQQIAARAAAEEATETGDAEDEDAVAPPLPAPPAGVTPFLIDDADRIADLRDAETSDEVLAALAPLVEDLITRPRFFDLERGWKNDALPRLEPGWTPRREPCLACAADFPRLGPVGIPEPAA